MQHFFLKFLILNLNSVFSFDKLISAIRWSVDQTGAVAWQTVGMVTFQHVKVGKECAITKMSDSRQHIYSPSEPIEFPLRFMCTLG